MSQLEEGKKSSIPFLRSGILGVDTLDPSIRTYIENRIYRGFHYYKCHKITLYTFADVSKQEIELMISRAYIMRQLFAPPGMKRSKIRIYYFPTPYKKMMPKFKQPLEAKHINSGFTFAGKFTVIFRQEEALKVLVHEMLHYYKIDAPYAIYNVPPELFFNYAKLKKNKDLLIDEVFAETYAIILNAMFVATEKTKDFEQLLEQEREFGIKQSGKILSFFGFQNIDQFIKHCCNDHTTCNNSSSTNCAWLSEPSQNNRPILEVITSAVVEYYFLRSALLFKLPWAMQAISNPNEIMNILTEAVNNLEFKKAINNSIKYWVQNDEPRRTSEWGTLRMSIVDSNDSNDRKYVPTIAFGVLVGIILLICLPFFLKQ